MSERDDRGELTMLLDSACTLVWLCIGAFFLIGFIAKCTYS